MEDDVDMELYLRDSRQAGALGQKPIEAYKSKTETTAAWGEVCGHAPELRL